MRRAQARSRPWLARYNVEEQGLAAVIRFFSALLLIAAVGIWLVTPRMSTAQSKHRQGGFGLGGLIEVLRLRVIWLNALVVFGAYWAYWGAYDLAAFARDAFDADMGAAATLSSYRMWFRAVAPLLCGVIADRWATASSTSFVCMALLTGAFLLLGLMPVGPSQSWMLCFFTTIVGAALFGVRGVYFALIEECGVPPRITGRAVGVISIVGFLPDFLAPLVLGELLHRFALVRGHQLFFLGIAAVSLIGTLAALGIGRSAAGYTRR